MDSVFNGPHVNNSVREIHPRDDRSAQRCLHLKEANWLPAPKGPFAMYMRLYWPTEEAMEGKWTVRRS